VTPKQRHSGQAVEICRHRAVVYEQARKVNGQIKAARGLRSFLLRGLEKVDSEWHLIAATHNLLKLFRHRRSQQQALAMASG
jgi:hypothetical protein